MNLEGAEAFILAGGRSTRMGVSKASLTLGGLPLLCRVGEALANVFDRVTVVGGSPGSLPRHRWPAIPDAVDNKGPLGGLQASLRAVRAPNAFIASCDLPFLDPQLVRHLWSLHGSADVTIPTLGGRRHPLCGFYSSRILPEVEAQIARNELAMFSLLARVRTNVVDLNPVASLFHPGTLLNANTPSDLAACERALAIDSSR